jgi:hypothetical protein
MPDVPSSADPQQSSSAPPIDDLMLAMDVVDTLRHNQDLVARELDDTRREAALIDRLREIYRSQGIAVSDIVLQEGVQALKERRFAYSSPQAGWRTSLAHLWVSRRRFGKVLLAAAAAAAVAWAAYRFGMAGPERRRAAALRIELGDVSADMFGQMRLGNSGIRQQPGGRKSPRWTEHGLLDAHPKWAGSQVRPL